MEKTNKTSSKSETEQKDNRLGLDPDEQVMNGNYGMAETKEEDRQH